MNHDKSTRRAQTSAETNYYYSPTLSVHNAYGSKEIKDYTIGTPAKKNNVYVHRPDSAITEIGQKWQLSLSFSPPGEITFTTSQSHLIHCSQVSNNAENVNESFKSR